MEFKEVDGVDFAAVTVQMPGGERVPFLFSVKVGGRGPSFEGEGSLLLTGGRGGEPCF